MCSGDVGVDSSPVTLDVPLPELAHASRLSTAAHLVCGIAHELTHPLSVIMCYAAASREMVKAGTHTPAQLLTDLDRIYLQAQRAGSIIDRLRQFVRKTAPHRILVDINSVIEETASLIAYDLKKSRVRLNLRFHRPLPSVHADALQIQQVLANLMRNALEAMRATEPPARELTIQTTATSSAVEVAVCDTGGGVPADLAERIFDQFFSTRADGMGMGLPISRAIIQAHGGRLWLEPSQLGGAVFRFQLPLAEVPPVRSD